MKPAIARFYWSRLPVAGRVLDVGCGDGSLARYKPPKVQIYGIDKNVREASHAALYETVCTLDLDAVDQLPYDDEYFDAVVAKDVLEHLQKPWVTVEEIARVVRQDGIVMASVVCERGRRTWNDYSHVRGFTRGAARQLFRDAGLHVEGVWRMGPVPFAARLNAISVVPIVLTIPLFDWLYTSSYEIMARRRM